MIPLLNRSDLSLGILLSWRSLIYFNGRSKPIYLLASGVTGLIQLISGQWQFIGVVSDQHCLYILYLFLAIHLPPSNAKCSKVHSLVHKCNPVSLACCTVHIPAEEAVVFFLCWNSFNMIFASNMSIVSMSLPIKKKKEVSMYLLKTILCLWSANDVVTC